MQIDLTSLDVPTSTPITGKHIPLKELGILDEEEEEVLDLTRLMFDHVNYNIIWKRRKCYSKNDGKHLSVTTKENIVLDITWNPEIIASARTAFVTVMDLNVRRMNKQIA